MQKKLTITLDQDVYKRLCIVVGNDDTKSCVQFIEKLVQGSVANCYSSDELDRVYLEEGQEAAFQARLYARNDVIFADEAHETQFQAWLAEEYRASEEEQRLEEKFLARLESDYSAEYEDPVLESEFRKWLLEGRLWIMDDKLQKEAEFWAKTLVSGSDPS
jgi:hypothetical protein